MKTRRDFLRLLSLTGAGLMVHNMTQCNFSDGSQKNNGLGIQLWTLRDLIKENLHQTLEKIGKIGYTSIEAYGFDGNFYGIPAKEFRKLCSGFGLAVHSSHTAINEQNAAAFAGQAAEAGLEYLVLPSMMGRPEATPDDFRRTAEEMNRIGKVCKGFGIRFAYHNHDFEFRTMDSQLPYDILMTETEPELVYFQPDIYWFHKADCDPIQYFQSHPGRFPVWHLKDLSPDGASCTIGNGIIDFKTLMTHAGEAGLNRIFVEQEHYSEGDPLYCADQSFRYIQSNL